MASRTFGWVQEASSFRNLKRTVLAFVPGSSINQELINDKIPRLVPREAGRREMVEHLSDNPLHIPYMLLKGRGVASGETRATSPCTGIIQAVLPGQRREYQSDWPADSYIRWAISLGLLLYDPANDTCSLSDTGSAYAKAEEGSAEERDVLADALLSNPPVCRVLTLLDGAGTAGLTKFEIGRELGFIGEAGFTSIPQGLLVEALSETDDLPERNKLKSDTEGTSDKYARMICSWLAHMKWVKASEKAVASVDGLATESLESWRLTLEGAKAVRRMNGDSRYARVPKLVMWEMLATKAKGRDYLRTRRALLILALGQPRTLEYLADRLSQKGFKADAATIQDDIAGFERIGLKVICDEAARTWHIADEICGLRIPETGPLVSGKSEVLDIKDNVRMRLVSLDHRYLSLIDLSFDGQANREFEFATADLFVNALGFAGERLGDSRKPDVCVYHGDRGIIIDNKAASQGYSLPMSQADEMCRYLRENQIRDPQQNPNEWWKVFDSGVTRFQFLFISSKLTGNWEDRVANIIQREHVLGGAVSAADLLVKADMLKRGKLSYAEFMDQMIL